MIAPRPGAYRAPLARAIAAAAAAVLAAAADAQEIELGRSRERGGTILGRVCLDLDGDGRCGPGDPGIAGARVLADGGQIALADGEGRFHLLEVPARVVLPDRSAYGAHVLVAEGLGVRRTVELPPSGAASADLAVPVPVRLEAAAARDGAGGAWSTPAPPVREGGRLRYALAGRAPPRSRVEVGPERGEADAGGAWAVPVWLAPGENRFAIAIRDPAGGVAVLAQSVFLVPRGTGGDLVVPDSRRALASFALERRPGGILVHGVAPAGGLRVAGIAPRPSPGGTFAAWVPAGTSGDVELSDGSSARAEPVEGRAGAASASGRGEPVRVALRQDRDDDTPGAALAAAAVLGDVELSAGRGGILVTARGAGAMRGTFGPVAVAAGVDLDDRDRALADLVRPRDGLVTEHALDPTRTFPTAGDGAAAGDLDPGRGRIWARIAAPGASLDLGTARTELTGAELGRFDRAFSGARAAAEGELGPLRISGAAFGATLRADASGAAPPRAAHDALAATGGSLLWLRRGGVVPGSDVLRVEWRDPFTGRLAAARTLVRGLDYEIEYETGRVVLARPLATVGGPGVASASALVTGDPFSAPEVTVHADYLFAVPGPGADDLGGGRVALALGPVAVAASAADEDRTGGSYRLEAASASVDLGPALRARAEVAHSRGAPFGDPGDPGFGRSLDGGFQFAAPASEAGGATAFHLEAGGAAGAARWSAWWRERPAGYADGLFAEARSARERGIEASADAGALGGTVVLAERRGADPRDPSGATPLDLERAVARAGWRGERVELTAEVVDERRDAPDDGESVGAGLRAGWRAAPGVELDASHLQGVRTTGAGRDPTFTAVGARLGTGATAVAARVGWGPELGPRLLVSGERRGPGDAVYGTFTVDPDAPSLAREEASAFGVRARAGAAEVFTEDQLARDPFGLRAARVVGAALEPAAGLRVSLSSERGSRLRLDGSEVARRSVGATASAVRGAVRLSARGETRSEGSDEQVLAGGAAEWLATDRLTLSARGLWSRGTFDGREGLALDAVLGAAWRSDRASALAKVARTADRRPGEARRDGVLASAAGTVDVTRRVALGAGLDLGLRRERGASDDRIAGSARVAVRVAGPLDVALEYARRAGLGATPIGDLDAVRAEAGWALGPGRLALGYNVIGFGGNGVDPATDRGRVYVRATLAWSP